MDKYIKDHVEKKIRNLAEQGKLSNREIVFFGASPASKEVRNFLRKYDAAIDMIVDNDNRKIGKESMGFTVKDPEKELLPPNKDLIILVYSQGYYREILVQLIGYGYKVDENIFVLNFKLNDSLPSLIYYFIKAVKGKRLYYKLMSSYPKESVLFCAPYTGTGDIYLAGLFFKEYIKRNNIDNYVFVVVSGACKKVASLFNIKNIEIVEQPGVDDIIRSRALMKYEWPMVILNDGWMEDPVQWIRGYKGLNFERMFRKFVFNLEDHVPFELPVPKNDVEIVRDIFEKHGLIKGRTVVLSPYSNTLFEAPDSFWEAIADYCISKGYAVCTNCAGEYEYPVKGTKEVFFSLENAITFMDHAGYFIGARSGLCDIISTSSCKKVILYEKHGLFYRSSTLEYFSLAEMGLCNDALELEYRSDIEENVREEVLKIFN
jgi:hypothetical protein